MERVAGIGPASDAWEASIIATILYPQRQEVYKTTHHSASVRLFFFIFYPFFKGKETEQHLLNEVALQAVFANQGA